MAKLDFTVWKSIEEKVPEIKAIPKLSELPDELPLEESIVLGRTEKYVLPKSMWFSFRDPKITDNYTRSSFVNEYFSVCMFMAEKNMNISLGADSEYSETVEVKHVSSTRTTQSSEFRISNVFEVSYGTKAPHDTGGSEYSLKDTLTIEYNIKDLKEYCNEDSVVKTRKITYLKKDFDRAITIWDFKKYIAIYRIYDGKTSLVAVDDYLYGSELLTYKRAGKTYIVE
ncbi:MAG: hypothetical protein QM697_13685 [Lachnospiraceae bacterium]